MDDWSSFRTTTSEQQRLRAALSGFCESQDLPEEQRAAYTAYLRKRIRPAVEMLIREDDFSKLENILQTGWLSDADRKRFLNLAADQQSRSGSVIISLHEIHEVDEKGKSAGKDIHYSGRASIHMVQGAHAVVDQYNSYK